MLPGGDAPAFSGSIERRVNTVTSATRKRRDNPFFLLSSHAQTSMVPILRCRGDARQCWTVNQSLPRRALCERLGLVRERIAAAVARAVSRAGPPLGWPMQVSLFALYSGWLVMLVSVFSGDGKMGFVLGGVFSQIRDCLLLLVWSLCA